MPERPFTNEAIGANVVADPEVLSALPGVIAEAKSGWKTSEFWISLLGIFGVQVGALDMSGVSPGVATAALMVAYVLSRGVAKLGVPHVPAGV